MFCNRNSKLHRKEVNVEDFTTEPSLPLAGFAVRWLALLIDNLIIMVVGFLIGLLLSFLGAGLGPDEFQALYGCSVCLSLLISAAYYVVCWTSLGAGPGGRLLGLRIVQRDGSPIDFGKALIRFLGSIVSSLVIGLGYLWAAFDSEKQTWHDKIASTYVVAEKEISQAPVIVALLFFLVLPCILAAVSFIAVYMLLAPQIDQVFQEIVRELEQPTYILFLRCLP